MPGKDRVINAIRGRLNALLEREELMEARTDASWTLAVKTALCEACVQVFPEPRLIYATDVSGCCLAQRGEWLFDVTCLNYDGDHFEKVFLAAECDWEREKKHILRDFRKLLVARAGLRVMVYKLRRMPFRCLEERVRRYQDNQPGDTYLLAGRVENRFEYYRIDIDSTLNVRGTTL